jgi:hypothetical protein
MILGESIKLTIMGFADLSISEIATDYHLSEEEVMSLCDRLGIAYRASHTRLALEDAKAVMLEILAQRPGCSNDLPSS